MFLWLLFLVKNDNEQKYEKLALTITLCLAAGAANAASSLHQICTDYTRYLGHVYGYAVSQDEGMRKKLVSDMTSLKLSEAMVQEELYKVATNENAKYQYSRLLNPDANTVNRSSFDYMVKACETAPDFAIPSWASWWPAMLFAKKMRVKTALIPFGMRPVCASSHLLKILHLNHAQSRSTRNKERRTPALRKVC